MSSFTCGKSFGLEQDPPIPAHAHMQHLLYTAPSLTPGQSGKTFQYPKNSQRKRRQRYGHQQEEEEEEEEDEDPRKALGDFITAKDQFVSGTCTVHMWSVCML